jgi:hypothetical protein
MTGSWWKGALLPFGKKPVFIKCTNSSLETLISSKGISLINKETLRTSALQKGV